MKKTTLAILLSISFVGQMIPSVVLAQEVFDYNYGGTTYDYNYGDDGDTFDYNYGGTTYDYNYGGADIGSTFDYNYGGTTYDYNYGDAGNIGSTFDYNYGGTTYDYNYGEAGDIGSTFDYNYGGTTYDYNYGDSGTTYDYNYGDTDFGTTYDYNYGGNGTTYDYNYSDNGYTTSGYTNYSYSTPSYTGYTYPSGSTGSTYTYPTYTYPTYTYPTNPPVDTVFCPDGSRPVNGRCGTPVNPTCVYSTNNANVSRYNYNYPSCTKVCTNGSTVGANATCPAIPTPCAPGTTPSGTGCIPTPVCVYPTTDPNVASRNYNYPTCTKICTNGNTVATNASCPTPTNPCPAGGYVRLPNGTCGCPAGTVPAMPDGCRPAPQQCIRTMIYEPNVLRYNDDYPACTKVCTNGQTVSAGASCPNIVNPPVLCSDGLPPSPTTGCSRTTIIPTINNTVCSDGLPPFNGSCVRTNTIPTITNTICSDGSYPINGSCTRVVTTPALTYQTCWDGTTIPLQSVCPSQYKVCANGTSIPVNQTCYYGNNYVPYTPPQVVKFNNVITSVTTEITKTSARCNGIGLIASGAASTGWFEYGETGNLGRETAKANIGSSPTAPFSNVLANLKPATTYYCRAVMQNQYGIVKGEIVAFTTKSTAVAYVKPVTKTTVKTTTKTVAKKNEIVCVDGSVVAVGSQTAASLINDGQKLVSLQIVKSSGDLSVGSQVKYELTVKNLSDEKLSNMTVKVTIPTEVVLASASHGNYDPSTHVLTIPNLSLSPYENATFYWAGTVAPNATVGKTLATTAYVHYSVPGSNVQDEVTAYVVGAVVPGTDSASSTGAKGVIGGSSDRGFLPDSLVEWLALIAIIFIIFILGRSVYTSYSNDRKASH
jgi:hypothetical protein